MPDPRGLRSAPAARPAAAHGDPVIRLRVGIDGRAFASPAPGIRRYVAGLIPALLALDDPPEVVVLGGPETACPARASWRPEPVHLPTNAGWMLAGLPRAAAAAGVDVLHAPAYTAPLWSAVPVVLTIHDVSYARHPAWYPYRRDPLRRLFYRASARRAAHVLTVSSFSASEIRAAYGLDSSRISVVPLGVSDTFAPAAGAEAAERVEAPYVLHVGDLHARRNLTVALDAVIEARRRPGVPASLALVLVGTDRGETRSLRQRAAAAGAPDALVFAGAIDEARLRALYQGAAAVVCPSLYEGFGLPALEAMASGTPVLAARTSALPELVGDAGLLLDPRDASAWADALVLVLTDRMRAASLCAAGRARAATFTWERTARATLDVYRRVARPRR